jgi:hypothetical protein
MIGPFSSSRAVARSRRGPDAAARSEGGGWQDKEWRPDGPGARSRMTEGRRLNSLDISMREGHSATQSMLPGALDDGPVDSWRHRTETRRANFPGSGNAPPCRRVATRAATRERSGICLRRSSPRCMIIPSRVEIFARLVGTVRRSMLSVTGVCAACWVCGFPFRNGWVPGMIKIPGESPRHAVLRLGHPGPPRSSPCAADGGAGWIIWEVDRECRAGRGQSSQASPAALPAPRMLPGASQPHALSR